MPLTPPPRLNAPEDAGSFVPNQAPPTPTPTSGMSGSDPGTPNPAAEEDMQLILQIVTGARKLAMKYPAAMSEIREITDAVQRLQMKVAAMQPPGEVPAPPQ